MDEQALRAWLAARIAAQAGTAPAAIDLDERFSRYGLDSVGAVALMAELSAAAGRELGPVLLWQHPSINALARAVASPGAGGAAPQAAGAPRRDDEPIAVVGLACRFPQAEGTAAYWRLLREGVDAIVEVPRSRWDARALFDADLSAPGKLNTRWGGFIEGVDRFEPSFFGISPREACYMDPQQRLMLELAWEAFEDAGVPPRSLRETATGVFVGVVWTDYASLLVRDKGRSIAQHTITGFHHSIVANRVSYVFGLQGPSVAIDTACSSSLVAVHLACESLRTGESEVALAGGVNLNLIAESTIGVAKFGGLSPDGRCFTFDARANGYVRGEGAGFVLLKRLSKAIADGDRVYCVLRGSAVNNDGPSNGLTAPHAGAQTAVLRGACARAGVDPRDVHYVEAHGTGTFLGDPIEASALGAVYGEGRDPGRPLRVGSVKTNIGHLEGAAGVAALAKVALAMHRRELPRSLNFDTPNPHIPFGDLRLRVQGRHEAWPHPDEAPLAGVSAFGFGGTNCHLIVEGFRAPKGELVAVAAKAPGELGRAAAEVAAGRPEATLAELRRSAPRGEGRAARAALVARSRAELSAQAEALAAGERRAGVFAGVSVGEGEAGHGPVFVFSGMGSQWAGMGRSLYATERVFRATIDACDEHVRAYTGWSLVEVLTVPAREGRVRDIDVACPAIVAVEIALAALWRSWGVEPAAAVGHSIGEVAAAHVAGALTLADAMRVICAQGAQVSRLRGLGAMALVARPWDEVGPWLAGRELWRAIDTSPRSCVVAGLPAEVDALVAELSGRKIFARRVDSEVPAHCPLLDVLRRDLLADVAAVTPRVPALPLVTTTVPGEGAGEGAAFGPEHWVRNLCDAVLLRGAVAELVGRGFEAFVELSPHPLLTRPLEEGGAKVALATLRRDEEERGALLDAAGALYARGLPLRLEALDVAYGPAASPRGVPAARDRDAHVLALSARTPGSLAAQIERCASWLGQESPPAADACFTLNAGRAHFAHRVAVVGRTAEELRGQLGMAAERARGAGPASAPKVAFVFTGQGAQYAGMGRALYATSPVFREAIDACDAELGGALGRPLPALLFGDDEAALERTEITQPALFAVAHGLLAMWRSFGVEPDLVLGHSVGEYAAAVVAGVLRWQDALRILAARGRAMARLGERGAMLSVRASEARLAERVAELGLDLAAVNAAEQVVVAGPEGALGRLAERLKEEGVEAKRLRVSHAFHSRLLEPMLDELEAAFAGVELAAPGKTLLSNLSGAAAGAEVATARYWREHTRRPVRFADSARALRAAGVDAVVEIGPHATLLAFLADAEPERPLPAWPSLRRGRPEWATLLSAVAGLYERGAAVDFARLDAPYVRRKISAPTYAFERARHWVDSLPRAAGEAGVRGASGGLVGAAVATPNALHHVVPVGPSHQPWLADHLVRGRLVAPGALSLAAVLAIAAERLGATQATLRDVELPNPLFAEDAELHVVLTPAGEGEYDFATSTREERGGEGGERWVEHARGRLSPRADAARAGSLAEARAAAPTPAEVERVYEGLSAMQIEWGPRWRRLLELRTGPGALLARLDGGEGFGGESPLLHPVVLDNGLASGAATAWVGGGLEAGVELMPWSIEALRCHDLRGVPAWAAGSARPHGSDEVRASDARVYDAAGALLLEIEGLACKRVRALGPGAARPSGRVRGRGELFVPRWRPVAPGGDDGSSLPRGAWLVLSECPEQGLALAQRLKAIGRPAEVAPLREAARRMRETPGLAGAVCWWRDTSDADPALAAERAAATALEVLQAAEAAGSPRLWLVVESVHAVLDEEMPNLVASTVLGLARSFSSEHPDAPCHRVDLEIGGDAGGSVETLWSCICARNEEPEIVIRGGVPYVLSLARAPETGARWAAPAGSVLITGGLGSLGLRVARWLIEEVGARRLVLAGRRPPSAEQAEEIEALRALGAQVEAARLDVADLAAVRALVASLPADAPLSGVIHAAGVLDDGVIGQQTAARLGEVFAPKVRGAWNLHEATFGLELDFFVLFSSVASFLGPAGQGTYAAANGFLDALARWRWSLGLPGVSVGFGPWEGGGMAGRLAEGDRARIRRLGLEAIGAEEALELMRAGVSSGHPLLAAFGLAETAAGENAAPVLRALAGAKARAHVEPIAGPPPSIARPQALDVARVVADEAGRVLGIPAAALATNQPLQELGLDSLMAVELRNGLSRALKLKLPATLVFDYPTVDAVVGYVRALAAPAEAARAPEPAAPKAAAPARADDPIAIVGIGCRYPGGVSDPASFWRLLDAGGDGIGEVPIERWDINALYDPDPDAPGKTTSRYGGFLPEVDRFDAAFFGITPREAAQMDPQHRLLLETAWEALEHAAIAPDRLADTDAGVFVGLMYRDYATLGDGLEQLDGYHGTGNAGSVASGRISYLLGLKGPSVTLDTACSSSLVAVHLACQAIRAGECTTALAGGATLMLTPHVQVEFSRLRGLAADGRCKSFDARADGIVWSEGCGVLVLKRLSAALADGDRVLAVIRGSAVNQDGRSNGLTAPNGPSQEQVIRRALATAGLAPRDVDYVEAHGTGTPLGDPIEAQALGAVMGEGRSPAEPLLLGSVKSNVGHTQAAAGAAGIIKAVLAMRHERLPGTLHFESPNPRVPWGDLPLEIVRAPRPWPVNGHLRRAGVSSFGISGTNAHVVLEEAPFVAEEVPAAEAPAELVVISARSADALRALAAKHAEYLRAHPELPASRVAKTLARGRSHFEHRLAVVGHDAASIAAKLSAFVAGAPEPGTSTGVVASGARAKVAFVFPGQGSQWLGMGRHLLAEPAFARALEAFEGPILRHGGFSVYDELTASPEHSRLGEVQVVQPVLFAASVALARLWQAWGLEPAALVGHSMGEVAAACVAGVLTDEDAARVICARSRLVRRASGRGGMLAVELGEAEAQRALAPYGGALAVAAVNGPGAVVVAGDVGPLEALARELEGRGVFARRVKVDYASHCGHMDALRAPLLEALGGLRPRAGAVPLASTVTGELTDGAGLDGAYWADNLRQPVRLDRAVGRVVEEGVRLLVEVSPHPVLVPSLEALAGGQAAVVGSTRREQPERERMLESLGALYTRGASIDWQRLHEGRGPLAELPTYAFQRERFWLTSPARTAAKRGGHPLVGEGRELSTEAGGWLFEAEVDGAGTYGEHRVQGAALLPATAFVEMALEAGARALGGPCEVHKLELQQPLVLGETPRRVQAVVRGDGALVVSSRGENEPGWTAHARAHLCRAEAEALPEPLPTESEAAQGERRLDVEGFYGTLAARGLEYGPAFRGLSDFYAGEGRARARLRRSERVGRESRQYGWHPALLDAALQATGACVPDGRTWVPAGLGRVRAAPGGDARASQMRAHVTPAGPDRYEGTVQVLDEGGRVLLAIEGLALAPLRDSEGDASSAWMHHVRWVPLPAPDGPAAAAGTWLVLADRGGFGRRLAARLEAQGAAVKVVESGAVDSRDPDAMRRVLHDAFEGGRLACRAIVYARALDGDASADGDLADLMAQQDDGPVGVTHLVQAVAQTPWRDAPRLWVLTRDAVRVAGSAGRAIGQASLWGLARTLAYEHAELKPTMVDVDAQADADVSSAASSGGGNGSGGNGSGGVGNGGGRDGGGDDELAARLLAAGGPDEMIALRQGQAYAARLAAGLPEPSAATAPAGERPYRLETDRPGTLEALTLRAFSPEAPGPDEVLIEVRAAGLNFLDVLSAMGLRPDQPPGAILLGGECAGVVTRVGERVRGVSPGDEVVAVVPGAMATHAVTKAVFVAPKPPRISFEEAAALPLVYMTAWYALAHLARLERGEKVLIHAATGGVGLAAIAIARKLGAEIYATAGRPEKRAHLAASGLAADHIMSSRGPEFGAELLAQTGGEGVDVVLNCLTGDAIAAGLDALAPYGRFLEIGKRDIYGGTRVDLSPFRKNLSYFAIDLARLMLERPEKMGGLLREVMALVERDELPTLPTRAFAAAEAAEAFRLMAEAKHIGKLCVSFGDRAAPIREASPSFVVRPDATYLITGGLGGLGLVLAERLVARGARHLALVGRRPPSAEASAALDRLRARGAAIATFEADVGRARDVATVLEKVRASMPPLRGLVHAAAVLDDRTLLKLDAASFARVLGPKLGGAALLHQATRGERLDFFVLYSSAASLLGSAGQGNYAAANACLDALAAYRAARGLPATSVQWGPWAEVGLAAAQANRGERLASRGIGSMGPNEALDALERVVGSGAAVAGVVPLDARQWLEMNLQLAHAPFFKNLARAKAKGAAEASLARLLREAPPDERRPRLERHVTEVVARVLRLDPARLEPDTTFGSLGLDSLMGLEIRNRLEAGLALKLPATLLWTYPSVRALAGQLLDKLAPTEAPPDVGTGAEAEAQRAERDRAQTVAELAKLGEDDLAALLAAELGAAPDSRQP